MRYNGAMKIFLAILRLLVKDLIGSLCVFVRHAPRFCADVVRDIKPAVEEVRNFFRGGERSRFSTGLLPLPGERSQREANLRERIVGGAAIFLLGAGVGGAFFVLAAFYLLTHGWVAHAVFWFSTAALAALMLALEFGLLHGSGNYRIGYLGERKVGEELEKYMRRLDCHVFHGFRIGDGGGDIDHIVVCLHGVFSVETKAYRKYPDETKLIYTPPVPPMSKDSTGEIRTDRGRKFKDEDGRKTPLVQNKDNALALRGILRKFDANGGEGPDGGKVFARRVVFFPEWEVDRSAGEDKFEFVCGAGEAERIKDFIRGDGREKLTADQVKGIADHFDGKLRKDEGELNRLGNILGRD